MSDYKPPLTDIGFVLEHVAHLGEMCQLDAFAGLDADTVNSALEEYGRFVAEAIAPLDRIGDNQGCTLGENNTVQTPEGFTKAYAEYVAAGWGSLRLASCSAACSAFVASKSAA
jgi:3-(methylthio)propanoyl-CoA dehydrogenase